MTFGSNVMPKRFGQGAPVERPPEPEVSPTSLPPLTADEINARIRGREFDFQHQPCYRCGHSLAEPVESCACCFHEHTPDMHGRFPNDNDPED